MAKHRPHRGKGWLFITANRRRTQISLALPQIQGDGPNLDIDIELAGSREEPDLDKERFEIKEVALPDTEDSDAEEAEDEDWLATWMGWLRKMVACCRMPRWLVVLLITVEALVRILHVH